MTTGPEGHRGRLRERFQRAGLQGFHDHEVLELVLSYAIPRRDLKPVAKALMAEFDQNLSAVLDASAEKLQEIDGIGSTAACFITLLPRLIERYQQDRWKKTTVLSSIKDTTDYLGSILGTERSEVFYVLALNSRNAIIAREALGEGAQNTGVGPQRLLAAEQIQRGTVNRAAVFPRLVVEAALKHHATAVILAHNHPGGDPQPSSADRQLTRKLKRILNDLDIAVHDHIIIAGPGNSYSFAEHGELE
jgi:DNA repair protein RadC